MNSEQVKVHYSDVFAIQTFTIRSPLYSGGLIFGSSLYSNYLMSNAVSDEHTVMFAFEDANVADVTMPGSRRRHSLTHDAQLPSVVLQKQPN